MQHRGFPAAPGVLIEKNYAVSTSSESTGRRKAAEARRATITQVELFRDEVVRYQARADGTDDRVRESLRHEYARTF